ncbi:MAG: hypothetical protein AB1467_02785 [Candidatus Diapherotrites archaeon]
MRKDGYNSNTLRINVISQTPSSLCGNGVCDLGESYSNCLQDCPEEKKNLLRVATESPTVVSGERVNVVVTEENGNSVAGATVIYAGKGYTTNVNGRVELTAIKGFTVITARMEGFEPGSAMLKFITARIKPECGNAVCEEDENALACPEDCREELDLMPFTVAGIALVLIVLFAVIIMKTKMKAAKPA